MRYSPKPGKTEGFCIGMTPEDRDVWDRVMTEVQLHRNSALPVLNGSDLSEAVEEQFINITDLELGLERASTNDQFLAKKKEIAAAKIHVMACLFRSVVS